MLRVTVCVSGGGTNLQAIIDRIADGTIRNAQIVQVVCNNPGAFALERAAKAVNAYDFITGKEDGFDTEISRFDNKVSGGEMQRIAAARMILKDPNYLIMDEATSGIDLINARQVMEGLSEVMKDKTIIMVSHDIEAIRKADVVVTGEGRLDAQTVMGKAPVGIASRMIS